MSRPGWPRSRRLADRVRRIVGGQLLRSADPRLRTLTLTRAEVSGDMGAVRLYYLVGERSGAPAPESPEAIAQVLDKASGYLRSKLASSWEYRKVPEIRFAPDRGGDAAAELQRALAASAAARLPPDAGGGEAGGADRGQGA